MYALFRDEQITINSKLEAIWRKHNVYISNDAEWIAIKFRIWTMFIAWRFNAVAQNKNWFMNSFRHIHVFNADDTLKWIRAIWNCRNRFGAQFPEEWYAKVRLSFMLIFSYVNFMCRVNVNIETVKFAPKSSFEFILREFAKKKKPKQWKICAASS